MNEEAKKRIASITKLLDGLRGFYDRDVNVRSIRCWGDPNENEFGVEAILTNGEQVRGTYNTDIRVLIKSIENGKRKTRTSSCSLCEETQAIIVQCPECSYVECVPLNRN